MMPATLEHQLMPAADVWRALQYDRALPSFQGREWGHHLRMAARLGEGVSIADAETDLKQIARDPVSRFTRPMWASLPQGVTVEPLLLALTSETRPAMLAVLAAVTLLMLIACVNVISLLLAQNAQRRAELAMRTALGASRGRVMRQLLTETLVLASAGGIAGLLAAQVTLRALILLGPRDLPRVAGLAIDAPVFWIAFAVTAVVGLLVALLPAWSNRDLKAVLPQGSWQVSSHHVMRRSLVVAEVAFALVLLAGPACCFAAFNSSLPSRPGLMIAAC